MDSDKQQMLDVVNLLKEASVDLDRRWSQINSSLWAEKIYLALVTKRYVYQQNHPFWNGVRRLLMDLEDWALRRRQNYTDVLSVIDRWKVYLEPIFYELAIPGRLGETWKYACRHYGYKLMRGVRKIYHLNNDTQIRYIVSGPDVRIPLPTHGNVFDKIEAAVSVNYAVVKFDHYAYYGTDIRCGYEPITNTLFIRKQEIR